MQLSLPLAPHSFPSVHPAARSFAQRAKCEGPGALPLPAKMIHQLRNNSSKMPACWWKKTAIWRRRSRRRTLPHSAGRLMRSTPQIPPESRGQPFETTGMGRQNSSRRCGMAGTCETAPGHATRIEHSTGQTAELLPLPRAMPTQPVSNMLSNEMDESDTR